MSFEEFDDHTPDYQYEDDIPDLSDPEEDHEEEWKNEWRNFEMACRETSTTPFAAFGLHISKVNKELECKMRDVTDELSLEEIKQLINLTRTPDSLSTNTASKSIPSSTPAPSETPRPVFGPERPYSEVCTISLQKGLTALQINKFILHINTTLEEKKDHIKEVQVITKDWPQPYHDIPAAKKLHEKYFEAGLAGCLIYRGYEDAAHKLYCIAYEKAKIDKKTQNIIYRNIDQTRFKQKITQSADAFLKLLPSKSLPQKPSVVKSVSLPSKPLSAPSSQPSTLDDHHRDPDDPDYREPFPSVCCNCDDC